MEPKFCYFIDHLCLSALNALHIIICPIDKSDIFDSGVSISIKVSFSFQSYLLATIELTSFVLIYDFYMQIEFWFIQILFSLRL